MRSLRHKRSAYAGLAMAGVLLLLGAACSSQQDLPDMPPFAGTAAYLEMQDRIRKAIAAGEESRESLKAGYRTGQARRGQGYLKQIAQVTERMRLEEEYKQRERERFERIRAEEARRNYVQYFETLHRREALQRERQAARESVRRRGDSGFLRDTQAREAARQDSGGKEPARSAGSRTPLP